MKETINSGSLSKKQQKAFTLVELLVALVIVSILGIITISTVYEVRKRSMLTREVSAGKNVGTAYLLFAHDNNGELMPALNRSQNSVSFGNRKVTFAEAPHRYPYRLAPYLDYTLEGAIFVNGNREQIIQVAKSDTGGLYDYLVSLWPSLGMNRFFVGGTIDSEGNRSIDESSDVVTHLAKIEEPLIVFVSGGAKASSEMNFPDEVLGYHDIQAPHSWSSSTWTEESLPSQYGQVSARHNGQAVCVFTDGSVQALTIEELRDMRLWSRNAQRENDPNYRP